MMDLARAFEHSFSNRSRAKISRILTCILEKMEMRQHDHSENGSRRSMSMK
jgi:hypothetical protein